MGNRKVEAIQTVRTSYCELWVSGWVGGWVVDVPDFSAGLGIDGDEVLGEDVTQLLTESIGWVDGWVGGWTYPRRAWGSIVVRWVGGWVGGWEGGLPYFPTRLWIDCNQMLGEDVTHN